MYSVVFVEKNVSFCSAVQKLLTILIHFPLNILRSNGQNKTKEGHALSLFFRPLRSQKMKVTVQHFLRAVLLAHLSQRLIGELIVYPWSVVRRRPSVLRPQCSNIFFSETAWPIKAKFYVAPPWEGGMKVFFAAFWSHDQDGRHADIW